MLKQRRSSLLEKAKAKAKGAAGLTRRSSRLSNSVLSFADLGFRSVAVNPFSHLLKPCDPVKDRQVQHAVRLYEKREPSTARAEAIYCALRSLLPPHS